MAARMRSAVTNAALTRSLSIGTATTARQWGQSGFTRREREMHGRHAARPQQGSTIGSTSRSRHTKHERSMASLVLPALPPL